MIVHTRLVVMAKTSRALLAVAVGTALAAAMLIPTQSSARPTPPPPPTPTTEFVMWCPDESLINGGKFYAWMVRRC